MTIQDPNANEVPGHAAVEERYPPTDPDREAVAEAVLDTIDRFVTTIIAEEVAVHTEFTPSKTGQILTAMHEAPGDEPFTVSRVVERQAANRYYIDVEVDG
jgi:hypothetical protein